jgi:hypothetical protein
VRLSSAARGANIPCCPPEVWSMIYDFRTYT